MRPQAPCRNCDERVSGCHGKCDLYLTFRRALDDYNQKVKRQRYNEADDYLIEATIKRNK